MTPLRAKPATETAGTMFGKKSPATTKAGKFSAMNAKFVKELEENDAHT